MQIKEPTFSSLISEVVVDSGAEAAGVIEEEDTEEVEEEEVDIPTSSSPKCSNLSQTIQAKAIKAE